MSPVLSWTSTGDKEGGFEVIIYQERGGSEREVAISEYGFQSNSPLDKGVDTKIQRDPACCTVL